MEKNSVLLQEEEENVAEETNEDADVNSKSNEINDKNKDMVVTIKKDKKALEYQETMNLDIENILSTDQPFWRSIYEVIYDSYFGVVKCFPKRF